MAEPRLRHVAPQALRNKSDGRAVAHVTLRARFCQALFCVRDRSRARECWAAARERRWKPPAACAPVSDRRLAHTCTTMRTNELEVWRAQASLRFGRRKHASGSKAAASRRTPYHSPRSHPNSTVSDDRQKAFCRREVLEPGTAPLARYVRAGLRESECSREKRDEFSARQSQRHPPAACPLSFGLRRKARSAWPGSPCVLGGAPSLCATALGPAPTRGHSASAARHAHEGAGRAGTIVRRQLPEALSVIRPEANPGTIQLAGENHIVRLRTSDDGPLRVASCAQWHLAIGCERKRSSYHW